MPIEQSEILTGKRSPHKYVALGGSTSDSTESRFIISKRQSELKLSLHLIFLTGTGMQENMLP